MIQLTKNTHCMAISVKLSRGCYAQMTDSAKAMREAYQGVGIPARFTRVNVADDIDDLILTDDTETEDLILTPRIFCVVCGGENSSLNPCRCN